MGARGLQGVEHSGELQLQLVTPVLGGGVVETLHPGLSGVVDESVDAAELLGGAADEAVHGARVPDVADSGQQAVVSGAEVDRHLGEPVGVTATGGDAGTLVEQGADRGQADARAAAGDHDGAVGESQIHNSSLLQFSSW